MAFIKMPDLRPSDDKTVGMDHISFGYDSLEYLSATYAMRKDIGILPSWCVNHGPKTSMYYKDPDGNMSEHQVDNFDSLEETTEQTILEFAITFDDVSYHHYGKYEEQTIVVKYNSQERRVLTTRHPVEARHAKHEAPI